MTLNDEPMDAWLSKWGSIVGGLMLVALTVAVLPSQAASRAELWLGIGLASKVALSFILVAVLIFFTVFTGIRQVDRRLVERVITLGGDRWALVRHVYLPSVTAWVLSNLKIAVGFAFTGACVGEFVAATRDPDSRRTPKQLCRYRRSRWR